ncbi:ABC transporter substrate-binding protein [Bifidobacterium panos]|uniref:ABC transporter substrate-binding protein n=1 Tax=Bifidobacterium panos TaxID=2675321 RepID=A0ABX1SXT9_9BIFI|nr:extracellular solute-binding protein [Bifidobacterium sp. DSM 109963]NMN02656.1 ABC transporter substrate-binding protein [Bifidobacterium sp. DSM 109963]
MNKVVKRIIGGSLAATLMLSMAACGSSSSSSNSGSDAKEITLTFADDQNGAYKTLAEQYEKEKGVKVNVMEVPYSDLSTKLSNAVKANDLPDIARVPQIDPVWSDQLEDLSDLATKYEVMDSLIVKNDSGQVLTIPSDLTAVGLFINTTLFDKAGVSYPSADGSWTWDEFIDSLKKVQEATGAKYGMVMDASTHRERSFLYQFGSKGVQQQSDGSWALDDKAKTALEYLKNINDDSIMPKSVWLSSEDPSSLFKSGQVAAYYSGNWQVADFVTSISSFDWKTVVMPSQPTRATNVGTNYMVAYSEAGKQFLDWFYSKDVYSKFCQQGNYLSALDSVTPTFEQRNEDMQLFQEEIAKSDQDVLAHQITVQLQLALKGSVLPSDDPMKEETIKYLSGEEDVDTAIKNMNTKFTKYYTVDE